ASLTIGTRRSRAALSSAVLFPPTGLMLPEPAGGDCAYYSMEGARQGRTSSDELPLPSSRARGRGGEGEDRTRPIADHAPGRAAAQRGENAVMPRRPHADALA